MAERIPLVMQPPKTTVPKVWQNGAWADAADTDVVTTTGGKISESVIPEYVIVANAPDWVQSKSWKKGALAYYNGQVYRANNDIPTNTPFTIGTANATWKVATSAAEVSNIPNWNAYNPSLDRAIKEGEIFYYSNALYRARVNNVGNDVTSANHFEKLGGFVMPPPYVFTKSYTPGETIKWQGYYVTPNSNIGGNVPFEWGSGSQVLTWRPVLYSGQIQYSWKGVMTANGIGFFIGDVIAPTPRSNILYVCITATAPPIGSETTPLPAYWAPLINDTPVILDNYVRKGEELTIAPWAISKSYTKDAMVMYTDNQVYISNAAVPANTAFVVGTTGATWKSMGGGAVTDFVVNQAYPTMTLVRSVGEIYISNNAIPANTPFAEGTTGATWKKLGSSAGALADVNYINADVVNNATIGGVQTMSANGVRGMTMTGGGFDVKAGQTYLVTAGINTSGASTDATFRFSTSFTTGNTSLIGPVINSVSASYNTTVAGLDSIMFVYSPTVNETLYLKRTAGTMSLSSSYASIVQISGTNGSLPIFQGATNAVDGKPGVIPAPVAGAEKKILFGDGEWKDPGELLSSEIPYVCGSIESITAGAQTAGSIMPIYKTKNYGIDCVGNKLQLKANQTYLITTSIHMSGANYGAFRWYNVQTAAYVDQGELLISDASGATQSTGGQGGTFVYTPTTNCDLTLVRSRTQSYPGTSNGYSQWTCVRISGTAGSFPIFEGSTATVPGKAGALAAAPASTQDYVLYGSGEWKPLNAASSTNVVVRSPSPAATGTFGGGNVFLDRQQRVNVDGVLSKVSFRNYATSGAIVVVRPQSGDSSFSTGGKFDLLGSFPFASGATSLNPGLNVKIGDFVGVWISSGTSPSGTYAANGPTNNLIWITTSFLPTMTWTMTTASGNNTGLADLGFEITTLSSSATTQYVGPKIAYGSFANTGSSSGFSGIQSSVWDNIGLTGNGTTTFTLPVGEYLFEWCFNMTSGNTDNSFYFSNVTAGTNATISGSNQSISFFNQETSWREGDAPVGATILKSTNGTGSLSFSVSLSVGNSGVATPSQTRSWYKITKLK